MHVEPKPNRGIAVLLALVGPWGTGHYYLGVRRRALAWFLVPTSTVFVLLALVPSLGPAIGFGAVLGFLAILLLGTWLASLVDLIRVPEQRLSHVGAGPVALYWIGVGVVAILVSIGTRVFLLEAYKIPSGAMMPTLLVGDHIFVDKLVYRGSEPERGEVIVFRYPENPNQDFVKRVVAIPGDELLVRDGRLSLNGWDVPHCLVGTTTLERSSGQLYVEYLGDHAYLAFYDSHHVGLAFPLEQGPFVVRPGEYLVMGDNRHNSHDSRTWFEGRGGGVPRDLLKGRAIVRWMTLSPTGMVSSRIGTAIDEPLLPPGSESLEKDLLRCLEQRPPTDQTVPPSAR